MNGTNMDKLISIMAMDRSGQSPVGSAFHVSQHNVSERFPLIVCSSLRSNPKRFVSIPSHLEWVFQHITKPIAQSRFPVLVVFKEFQVFRTLVQCKLDTVLEIVFCQINVIRQISKGNFWLNHPKFTKMTNRMTIFSTKCRSERVHIRQGTRVCLYI